MAHADAPLGAPTSEGAAPRLPDSEPIPGYRLLQPLGRGGFGEVWKCEAPGGLLKAIKIVQGRLHALDDDAPAEEELRAIERVKAIRHPFILSMERVERVGDELVIVLELADRNLLDLYQAERKAGKIGIPRDALLGYLREAAEALDVMNARYDLQHLDIKPQNLFLISNHVKVGDFGLVNCHSGREASAGLKLGAITPVYASPEVFQGSISRHSDQYSLAIVYQELLTGALPFTGKNARQLMVQHLQEAPALAALPEADRPAVARALAKSPGERFPSCSDFVHALVAGQTEVVSATVPALPAGLSGAAARAERDTHRTPSLKTVTIKAAGAVPPTLTGLEVGGLVARTPLTEVWQGRAPDGSPRVVKVVFGFTAREGEAAARLARLRHPALPPTEVVPHGPGRLVLVSSPVDRNLRDCLQDALACGLPGVPRARLLAHLSCAAEALHELAREHGLAHLALSPRNLLLDGDRLLLGDFGLAGLLWLPAGQDVAQLNNRYSAPELFRRQASPACDQYSLALIYLELLTGALPPSSGRGAPPPLDRLPESDRPLLARALHPDPARRFESCVELVRALVAAAPEAALPVPGRQGADVLETGALQTRFGTTLAGDDIRRRLEGFREQWKGKVVTQGERLLVLHMHAPSSLWQRWTGRQPALEMRIQLDAPPATAPFAGQARTEVRVDVRPHQCSREQAAELLKVTAPLLVESVRAHLHVSPRGRAEERLIWQHPLQVSPVQTDGSAGAPVECHGKDISLNGIGFYLPGQPPAGLVRLSLPQTAQTAEMTIDARVVRVQGCGDGWHEVGCVLLREGA